MLRLHTFGGCFLDRDSARLDALSGQRRGLALLAMLAAAGSRGVSRDVVLAHFWPESDEDRARISLRQLIHALRTQLAAPDLLLASAELRLNPDVVTSDVAAFREALGRGDRQTAVALYTGPFLDGFHVRGAEGFEKWATTERAALAHEVGRALEELAEHATTRGDARAAVDCWRRLANAEPLSGRAAVGLIRALDASGDRAAALRHARVYETLVRDEVGGAPDPSVAELAARLRCGEPATAAGPAGAAVAAPSGPGTACLESQEERRGPAQPMPTPSGTLPARQTPMLTGAAALVVVALAALAAQATWRNSDAPPADIQQRGSPAPGAPAHPSVAVLPFANTSGDPANEPFTDGLTDELIAALGKVPDLKVAGRTSAYALKGKGLSVRAVGDTLGVASVVEASVRRAGDRIKVTAQLVSVRDNTVLWAETYEHTVTDVFAVQEEIAQSIVAALRGRLVGPRGRVLVARPTEDPVAYELYLRGRHIFNTRLDRDAARQAARYFEQAVARDPAFARAHAALSDVHTRRAVFGFGPPREAFALAKAAAERALAHDSTVAEAHSALAHARCVADFDWRSAERGFRRAIALDPGYTFARLPFAMCLMSESRFAEAIAQLDTARSADPLAAGPSNLLGRVYVSARQPELAIQHLSEALELNPQLDLAHQQLGHAYLQQGRHGDAIAALQRAAALSGMRDSAHLAYAYATAGQRSEADRIVRSLVASGSERYVPPFHVAMAYAGLGNADDAFRWLARGFEERASFMGGLAVTPAFDGLHGDPRWKPLLRKMGLAADR